MDKRGIQPWVAQPFSASVFSPRQPPWSQGAVQLPGQRDQDIRTRREVPLEEAVLAARDVLEYLERNLLTRNLGQIQFPAISGRDNHQKRSRASQPEKVTSLTVVAEEDIELMAEFGSVALQRGRLACLVEEAHVQDAILDTPRLCVLFPQTHRGIRAILQSFS